MISVACAVVIGSAIHSAAMFGGGVQSELAATWQRGTERASADWLLSPWLGVRLASPEVKANFRYSPRLALRSPPPQTSPAGAPELLHSAAGDVHYALSRRLELLGRIGFERGRVELGPLRLPQSFTGVDAATTAPSASNVEYVNAAGSVGLNARADRRTRWSASIGYRITGDVRGSAGLTSSDDRLPLQLGPEWTISVDHALTKRDELLARAGGSGVFQGEAWVVQGHAMGGWRRALSRNMSFDGALGLGAQTRGDPRRLVPMPVGSVAIAYDAPTRAPIGGRISIGALPFVDPFMGSAYLRTEASLAGWWSLGQAFRLQSLVAAGTPVGREALLYEASGYADCGATVTVRRGASLTAGMRWAVQRRALGEDHPKTQWGAFVGFSYELRSES